MAIKHITLDEAQQHYAPKPEHIPVNTTHAYTLTKLEDGWEKVEYWVKKKNFNALLGLGEGYIYILANKGIPGVLKIGYTDRTPQDRVREINGGTGVITPWYIVNSFECKSPSIVESIIHSQLREYHVNKEGFAVSISFAEELISRVIIANNAQIL